MQKLNILVAYPYMKPDVISILNEQQGHIRFLLDSGAFTAWKAGKPIALDDYCKFLESLPFKPWRYFTLDVIGNPDASLKNYEIMLSRGFNPIPIFTRGEDIRMIDEYYKTSDVIGIGGLVGTQGNKGFVKGIMNVVNGRKVHWLGFTSDVFVSYYKPYMCDSSSWNYADRVGSLALYYGFGRSKVFSKKDFIKKPSDYDLNIFLSYGITSKDLSNSLFWKNGKLLNTFSARMWIRKGFDFEKKLGTNLFLACGTKRQVETCIEQFKKETRK